MDNLVRQRIGRFDQVKLITTNNVSYLSAEPGTQISPKGIWSVAAVLDEKDLLCVRKGTTIKIPAKDVLKVVGYDVSEVTKHFGKLSHGKEERDRPD